MKKSYLLIIPALLLSSCQQGKMFSKTSYYFDTFININNESEQSLKEIDNIFKKYHQYFDNNQSYEGINNIYTINHSDVPVVLDYELYDALKTMDDYIGITNGYFNPLIGNLSSLWKSRLSEGQILNEEEINVLLNEMNNSSLIFNDEEKSILINGNASLDLGAFAKGYTLYIVNQYMIDNNFNHYLIDAGNSSILLGEKNNAQKYKVGIKYLNNSYIEIKNSSIGTSGIYEQLFEIDNKIYSHIINPFTGDAKPNYDFVIVIDEDPTLTDVFSTVLMNLTIDEIKQYEQLFDIQTLVSKDHQIIYQSSSLEVKTY